MADELLNVTLPAAEAGALRAALRSGSLQFEEVGALRQTGEAEFVTIILPCVLTAVQVVATFIASRAQKPPAAPLSDTSATAQTPAAQAPPVRVKIGKVIIAEANFGPQTVEQALGRRLDEN